MAHSLSSVATGPKLGFSYTCPSCIWKPKPNPKVTCSAHKSNPLAGIGIGIVASSVVALTPFNADATRIEYYATTAEPLCEYNYVKSGLGYCDILEGFGDEAPLGELINVHYTARFGDERVFDSSYKRGRPLTMRIGVGKAILPICQVQVIKGLDQGILGGEGVPPMRIGGKRKLKIPPMLAYGPEPAGCFSGDCNIPGNATLLYDINFVGIYSGNRK
ncbi:hypothetical protein Ahy_A03g011910 isoform A [Arachis hypogaea]|uniref:peptidylprolyl isomerase n=1 Tax=Arachis hypogaea TaxID=3818 RepID=A0A445DS84_ARAHY|nr:hypothetical protein Ahy_A03g011910 isoform A [Arachis hypogaea]